jgi:hypothetical protein
MEITGVSTGQSDRSAWRLAAVALTLGLLVGFVIGRSVAPHTVQRSEPRFDSPRVTDLPVTEAADRLVAAGFDVVAVGSGTVTLQELGNRPETVRIKGSHGRTVRYCDSEIDCVIVPRE